MIDNYPNLQAILNGTISGKFQEWPAIRRELESLAADACNMCVSTKRGPARVVSDTIGDISAQYLKLEDGSGIGMNEADMYVRGFRNGLLRAAEISENTGLDGSTVLWGREAIRKAITEFAESV